MNGRRLDDTQEVEEEDEALRHAGESGTKPPLKEIISTLMKMKKGHVSNPEAHLIKETFGLEP